MTPNEAPYAVQADNSLRKKLGGNFDANKLFSAEKIKECQALFDDAHKKFFDEALGQLVTIEALYRQAAAEPEKALAAISQINAQSHLLKGRMDMLGFRFCYDVANSLYGYTQTLKSFSKKSHVIVEKHIEALQAALRENRGIDGGTIGKEMMSMLGQLIQKLQADSE